ncbi:hypothetical protein LPJ66_005861 [Kickxella alabastrina]|uniref:Uncharacterized protein n=1 Tax=Kickxella alabastrina TaxID=61397 RepID=A0ACC1IFN0_9FUNG|nr:hypothetical protein LPJ66_005861 [Kickxella alabastrina]
MLNTIYSFVLSSTLLLLVSTLLSLLVVGTIFNRAYFTPLSKIPGPFLNSISNLPLYYHTARGQYHKYTISLHAKYGDTVRVGHDQVSLANGSELRRVLATHSFRKGEAYSTGVFPVQTMFSTTDPELNKTRRRQMGNTYSMTHMRTLEDTILEHGVLSLIECWDAELKKGADVNYFYGFNGIAFDVIGMLGYGKSFDMLRANDITITNNIQKIITLSAVVTILPVFKRSTWLFKDLFAARNSLIAMSQAAVARRKQDISNTNAQVAHADILQKIIDAKDPKTGQTLSHSQQSAEVMLMLGAGTETTANTLSWTMMYILHHPSVQRRLRQDIRRAFPDKTNPIRYDEAKAQLPYLTAVLHESMRLNSAAPGYFPRSVPAEGATLCGQYRIPPGAHICISFAASHRNPTVWANPDGFDPERFMGVDGEAKSSELLVFSAGVRACIGRNFALIELYTVLANLLRKYNFELPEDAPYGPHRIKDGIPVEIPGLAYTTCGPINPLVNCRVRITHAED